jgi:hypothetical protein
MRLVLVQFGVRARLMGLSSCHPEAAESLAQRGTPNEEPALSLPKGPMQLAGTTAAADELHRSFGRKISAIGSRTARGGPQDDKFEWDGPNCTTTVRLGSKTCGRFSDILMRFTLG